MKVLFVAGNARSLIANRGDLIAAMQEAGHNVSAAVPSEDFLDEVYSLGIDVIPFSLGRTGLNPIKDVGTFARILGLTRNVKPDVVFTYTIKPVVYGGLAARLCRVPRVYSMITGLGMTFSDLATIRARALRSIVGQLYRIGMTCSDHVFFQNPDDLSDFVRLGILRNVEKAVRVMGSGVNMHRFPREPLPNGKPVFLFVARMLSEKGVCEFVAAANLLKARWPEARFVAVGPHDPSHPNSVSEALMSRWKQSGVVEFVGAVNDVRPWLREASIFVLPSYYREGTPRSVLEAMSTGRPIITSDSPGCRETVIDGDNGFLVPPRDAIALSLAMERFLEEPELISKMGDASFRRVVKDYDVRRVNDVILSTMELV
ncbi:MAG: glycosyltransferase family 4 protein [Polycyclovorans sp.]|nr:glycosyltransferase family 4 protein [Polycyclovorans sp.]